MSGSNKLNGVALSMADPSPANSSTMHTVGWVAKTEIYVLTAQLICPVRKSCHNFEPMILFIIFLSLFKRNDGLSMFFFSSSFK